MLKIQKEWTGASDFQLRPNQAELNNGEFFSRDITVSVEVVTVADGEGVPHADGGDGSAEEGAALSSPVYRVTVTGVMGQSSVGCTRRFGSFRALKNYMGVRPLDHLWPEGRASVLRKVGLKLSEKQLHDRATRLQGWLQALLAQSGSHLSHWQAEALAQFLHMKLISKPSSDPSSPKLTAQPTPAFLPRSQRAYSSSPPCMLKDSFSLKEVDESRTSRTESSDSKEGPAPVTARRGEPEAA